MKIDFIINSLDAGGAERVLSLVADELANREHQIRVITLNNELADAYVFDNNVERIRLQINRVRNHSLNNGYNLYRFYKERSNRPDVAVAFISETAFLATIAVKLLRSIPLVVSEHTNFGNGSWFRKNIIRKRIYKWVDRVLVLTHFDKNLYQKNNIATEVMYNPCSFAKNQNTTTREKVLLGVGNLNKYHIKGYDNLIRTAAPVLRNHQDWKIRLIGKKDAASQEVLVDLAKKMSIEKQIELYGFSSEVAKLMREAEVFVLSSRTEGLPMVLLEALSQGTACIAFDCRTGPSEIIENGKNGILVPDQDMDAMQNAIERMITDDDLRHKYQVLAPNSIAKFELEKVTDHWERVLNQVIEK
ncbi:MAG: glycosyltransferase family 4 protein [Flavobacteriaceae bacterium]|nr:glycosyltransferase family 4 protein [Flavobacteriaceae bacterium]